MKKVVNVRFRSTGKTYYFNPGTLLPKDGDYVMVETSRGTECGEVVGEVHALPDEVVPAEVKPVVRLADDADVRRMRQNREDEKKAFAVAEERIEKHHLPMKLIDVEYAYARNKILFYFTADGRVDFRDLVKDLAGVFRTRIELRQIGVRDESKMLGGLGICGQPFCCSRFLKNFSPVSIKMAKEQGLSLNPAKISGSCGRLMCCLAYEQPAYDYLSKITPMVNSTVNTPDGPGTVTEVNLISGLLRVRLDNPTELGQKYYPRDEVEYVRGGKRAPVRPEDVKPDAPKPRGKKGEGGRSRGEGRGKAARGDEPTAPGGEKPRRNEGRRDKAAAGGARAGQGEAGPQAPAGAAPDVPLPTADAVPMDS